MSLLIESMSIAYGRTSIINDMSLSAIEQGSVVAVIGANGAGKSTFLKSLAGLIKHEGHVSFNKLPLAMLSQQQKMSTIGYLPQSIPQPSSLVSYELIYSAARACFSHKGRSFIETRIESVFEQLGIRDLALKKLQEMSGGQRQMVGLAQVLVRQPKLLLLDEPTSALDIHWQLNVLQAVQDQAKRANTIALFACHDLNLALRFCDQVLVLGNGGALALGPPKTVLSPEHLRLAYGIEGRIESCSQGYPIVMADRAV